MSLILNFLAVVLLIGLIATPIYFAKNFTKVSGVKTQSSFLIVSQIDKFPNLSLAQVGDRYTISYGKLGPAQAFLGMLILNNPTKETQTYWIEKLSGEGNVFFGQNLDDQKTQISAPSLTSVPISLYSQEESTASAQTVEFTIIANSE